MGCARLNNQTWLGVVKFVCSKAVQKGSSNVYEMERCKKYFVDRYKGNV